MRWKSLSVFAFQLYYYPRHWYREEVLDSAYEDCIMHVLYNTIQVLFRYVLQFRAEFNFFQNLTSEQFAKLYQTANSKLGKPFTYNGCINYVFDVLTDSCRFIDYAQFPAQMVLLPKKEPRHMSWLLDALIQCNAIHPSQTIESNQIKANDATMYILTKDWYLQSHVKRTYHVGLIFSFLNQKRKKTFNIFHNRQTVYLPRFILHEIGVIKHHLQMNEFTTLCTVWNEARNLESYKSIRYSMYYWIITVT